ncbi:hypothetical protein [uncultured Psychrobacter sp.]|uniref:hypothetical protein n=1 Tax=uncultured Psychrobacter sp. TaxID=259303 RepID=UPI0026077678|nr:hypothetical protein [uncultured Psychrobacter sp.]
MSDVITRRFATSERLEINGWVTTGLGAKTVKFDIGAGGLPPEVTWEDKSAALALIKEPVAKSLASLIVWGKNERWDWSESFNYVCEYLALQMVERCTEDKRASPKGIYSLDELARLIARMALHFELYNLWPLYSVEGRLLFSGIDISSSTYSQIWCKYEKAMLDDITELMFLINQSVGKYRHNLTLDNS